MNTKIFACMVIIGELKVIILKQMDFVQNKSTDRV